MSSMTFETGLAASFRNTRGGVLIDLALAERTGFSHSAGDWLRARSGRKAGKKIPVRRFGEKSLDEIMSLWEVLSCGTSLDILNCARTSLAGEPDEDGLSLALDAVVTPLIVLGRGSTVSALHAQLPQSVAERFTACAALNLGAAGEWDDALSILERAHRGGASPHIHWQYQKELWRLAYLQELVDTVLPRIAAIPFDRNLEHAAGERAWQLIAHRIRAGRKGVHVPAVAPEDQVSGYTEAVAIQIAALEGTLAAAEAVAELRGVFRPKSMSIHLVDRGVAFQIELDELSVARVRIAARRRDYAQLTALAQTPSRSLEPVSVAVIDALLEEGDWRGAADFADRYDLRDQPVFEGFDDTRMQDYQRLQLVLAAAAARDGDDTAAETYLARYLTACFSSAEADGLDREEGTAGDPEETAPGLWLRTLLAGAAEGVLPRHLLALFLPVFRGPF
jgi:hypothetical protein